MDFFFFFPNALILDIVVHVLLYTCTCIELCIFQIVSPVHINFINHRWLHNAPSSHLIIVLCCHMNTPQNLAPCSSLMVAKLKVVTAKGEEG